MYYLLTFKLSRAAVMLRETVREYAHMGAEEMEQKSCREYLLTGARWRR